MDWRRFGSPGWHSWPSSMLSLMVQSQVPLSSWHLSDRQSDLRLPGRKSLFYFDHAKQNYLRRYPITEVRASRRIGRLHWLFSVFQKLINIDQRLRNRESMLVVSPCSSPSTGD